MWKAISERLAMLKTDERGFTLVELLVVMIIIGILSGVGVSGYQKFQERAYVTAADAAWRDLQVAISLHEADSDTVGVFPRWGLDDNGDAIAAVEGTSAKTYIEKQLIPPPEPLGNDLWDNGMPVTTTEGVIKAAPTGFVAGVVIKDYGLPGEELTGFTCVWVKGYPSRFNNPEDSTSPCVNGP